MDAPLLLRAEGLGKAFGETQALADASLEIHAGEVVGLIGANGAGKSTLTKVFAGVLRPDAGRLLLDGNAVTFRSPHDATAVGIVIDPQELTLIEEQSIAENLLLGHLPTRLPGIVDRRKADRAARRLLDEVGLANVDPRRPAGTLTPVEARLVSIATALSKAPRLLILDEPSAALPTETARRLMAIVRALSERGTAIVYVSHRFGEIEELCSRVIAMRDGRIAGELRGKDVDQTAMIELVGGRAATLEPAPAAEPGGAVGVEPVVIARGLTGRRVRDVDLVVAPGEIVGIGGLYGSGRSELLRLLVGAQPVTAGELVVLGGPQPRSLREAARRGIGYLAERRRDMLFPDMTVTVNSTVAVLRRLNALLVRRRRESGLAREVLSTLNLKGELDSPVATLSGGNQQKVCISRWLLADSRLFLFDEPTVGIDLVARAEIHNLLKELAASGKAIVVASAEPEELVLLCHRVLVLAEGRVGRELSAPFDADSVVAASYASEPERARPSEPSLEGAP